MKTCLELCARAGYRRLDFGFAEHVLVSEAFQSGDWKEELLEYKRYAGERGLLFVQAHATILDFCNPGDDFEWKEELFRRSIVGAKLLGASWIVAHPSSKVREGRIAPKTHEENVRFFKRYAEFARETGIGIAVENMWGTAGNGVRHYAVDPEELLRLIEAVDCENVRICWDAEHGSIEKLDQEKVLKRLGKYIVATHISDETGINNIHILPYLGHMDWEPLLRTFAEIGYDGTFDFEIQHYLPGVPMELVPSAMKFSYEVGSYMAGRLEEMKREISAGK